MDMVKRRLQQKILANEVVVMPVISSNLSTWEYNPIPKKLSILFKKGTTYQYNNVDKKTVLNLLHSESVGKAFHKFIIGKFSYQKIEGMVLA